MIAALYVASGGCYFGLPDVDPWDEKRDAGTYCEIKKSERKATPPAFRDLLISIAGSARAREAA